MTHVALSPSSFSPPRPHPPLIAHRPHAPANPFNQLLPHTFRPSSRFYTCSTAERACFLPLLPTAAAGIAFGEVGKLLGERWKAMSPEDKAPYEELANKDKARYASAMRIYKQGGAGGAASPSGKAEQEDGEDEGGEEDE